MCEREGGKKTVKACVAVAEASPKYQFHFLIQSPVQPSERNNQFFPRRD